MSRRILLLSVSAGTGHVRAAQALQRCAVEQYGLQAEHLDAMDYVPASFRKLYADLYVKLSSRYPRLWGWLYHTSDESRPHSPMHKLRRAVERLNTRALRRAIQAFAPDAIVCTHFLPAEMLMHDLRRGRIDLPVWVQVTDFDLHRMWVLPHMAGYFTGNAEVAYRLQCAGVEATRTHATGIPVMPAFAAPPDRAACAAELGLDPQRLTFLLMGGGAGVGQLERIAAQLLALPVAGSRHGEAFQLIALAGRNQAALAALHALAQAHPGRLLAQGFSDRVERLMGCSDAVLSKPGGLTSAECLALGKPMLVLAPIPGQEERNADFLLEHGAALKAVDELALAWRVRELADHPERLTPMADQARALGRPHAARDALAIVLADLAKRKPTP